MSAESGFNAYLKWLGIPPQEQPPNYYRLLAIPQFENDPETIENAAYRQASYVKTFRLGEHVEHCAKLLAEIAVAKL